MSEHLPNRPEQSIKDAAERLGISEQTVRRRLTAGKLPGYKRPTSQGYEWRVYLDEDVPANVVYLPKPDNPPPHQADEQVPNGDEQVDTTEVAMRAMVVYVQPLMVQIERATERAERAERERDSLLLTVGMLAGQLHATRAVADATPAVASATNVVAPIEDTPGRVGASDAAPGRWARFKAWLGGGG